MTEAIIYGHAPAFGNGKNGTRQRHISEPVSLYAAMENSGLPLLLASAFQLAWSKAAVSTRAIRNVVNGDSCAFDVRPRPVIHAGRRE